MYKYTYIHNKEFCEGLLHILVKHHIPATLGHNGHAVIVEAALCDAYERAKLIIEAYAEGWKQKELINSLDN